MNSENTEKIFDVNEVARMLDKSALTIRQLLRNGKLHGTKHSNKQGWIITEQDLDDYCRTRHGLSLKDYLLITGYDGEAEEIVENEQHDATVSTKDVRVCPYCGDKSAGERVTNVRYSPDGYLIRYRGCRKCHVIRKTYEIYPEDFEKLVKLKKRVETLAFDLNKACEEAK